MRRSFALPGRQRGVATLLFILLVSLGLMAVTASTVMSVGGAQQLQYTRHAATQAEMSAWSGVSVLSAAVAQLPSTATPSPGTAVGLSGTEAGVSARYIGLVDNLLVFQVTGASAGAKAILQVAYERPGASSSTPANVNVPTGQSFRGNTRLQGSVSYTGTGSHSINVIDGSLTLDGSVTGLDQVCATGDVSIGAAIRAETVCSNGSVTLRGGATVGTINAIGNVLLSGGGTGTLNTINSNGTVTLSGGSARAGTINASRDVSLTGGSAAATTINTEGAISWTSSAVGTTLNANGTVNYRPSANPAATDITAIGDVTLTSARNVRTQGKATLVGYHGQGITGALYGQGLLSGSSWGVNGGAIVGSGTAGSVTLPKPTAVRVTAQPGYTVSIPPVVVPRLPLFTGQPVTVDAYALMGQANLVFYGITAQGVPMVRVSAVSGIADGNYYIANRSTGGANYLCTAVSGTNCSSTPLVKICQGYSDNNACFSYSNGQWTVQGTTMVPVVTWFDGDLQLRNGTWVNTFIASGDISTAGGTVVYAPNYPSAEYTCKGRADSPRSLPAQSSRGLNGNHYGLGVCKSSDRELTGASIGNVALLAGGYENGTFSGGTITLGASNQVYGAVLAGQYLNTGGSTTAAGPMYSAAQGGTQTGSNTQGGSTTIIQGGGSTAYDPGSAPCMNNCPSAPVARPNNIVWVSPI